MSILLRNRRVSKEVKEGWKYDFADKKILELFIEYYEECYGEPTYDKCYDCKSIGEDEIEYIYNDYRGFEDISLIELINIIEDEYHISYD